jgi:hypothetical protein
MASLSAPWSTCVCKLHCGLNLRIGLGQNAFGGNLLDGKLHNELMAREVRHAKLTTDLVPN